MNKVCIIGTLDTKGREVNYIKDKLVENGLDTFIIDVGVFDSDFKADLTNQELLEKINVDLEELRNKNDRAYATETLSRAMKENLLKIHEQENIKGYISLGGSGGTSIATAGLQTIPIGIPKIMVSTMASGNTNPYVGTSDIIMMPSIVDVAGLNVISKNIFNNACNALAGMVKNATVSEEKSKPIIAASMFGVTTPSVNQAMEVLEEKGYEVLVFHATGSGGKTMESLISSGYFDGVLDITTTEWCDELVGGVLSAGENRLESAALNGIPQVVSLGALDMVNFGPYDTVPKEFENRNLYKHNPTVTLMRTNEEENTKLGKIISEKLNMTKGKAKLLIPLKGVSALDQEGSNFYGPEENAKLFEAIKSELKNDNVEVIELDMHINDIEFSERAVEELLSML